MNDLKGPSVWLNMDQAELDAAYNQAAYAPNMAEVLQRHAAQSEAARAVVGEPLRFAYGDNAVEGLDIYATLAPDAPIAVFIHGGAWRTGRARDYAFAAPLLVRAGAHLVVPDFAAVQDVEGSLEIIAGQLRRALCWVYRHAERFGGNTDRIHVLGHSSGAHMAGVLLTTDWARDFGLPPGLIKTGLCCSGIFDLKPPRLSARSSYVRFTDEIEQSLSPQRHIAQLNAPLIVAYGTQETPEFQRQSRDFATAVVAAGKPVQL
ncbi:MAG: alpha/beta hydrolase, partial [Polaromonas sp.]